MDIILLGYNTDAVLDVHVSASCSFGGGFSVPYPSSEQLAQFARRMNLWRFAGSIMPLVFADTPFRRAELERLIERCFPMDNRSVPIPAMRRSLTAYGIDCMTNCFYRDIHAYVCLPPLVWSANDQVTSTIQS
jgi:hypothetical protein